MGAKEPCMVRPTVVVLSLLSLAAVAYADGGASGGSTATRPPTASEKEAMFRALDIDGDGFVSMAEAAGHEKVMLGFDRADRNRDGKLSFAEYDSIGKPRPARKNVAKGKSSQPAGSASAGSTKKAN
jgi:hypothetical protein